MAREWVYRVSCLLSGSLGPGQSCPRGEDAGSGRDGCVWAALWVGAGGSLLWEPTGDPDHCLGLTTPNSGAARRRGSCPPDSHASSPSPSPVRQYADICLFNTAQYKCPVALEEAE